MYAEVQVGSGRREIMVRTFFFFMFLSVLGSEVPFEYPPLLARAPSLFASQLFGARVLDASGALQQQGGPD